jgi:aspartate kinase
MSLAVLKFGGTSVGDANAIRQCAHIVRDANAQFDQVAVVTSAMGKSSDPRDTVKVTDTLLEAARSAAAGDGETYSRARRALADKHHAAIDATITNPDERHRIGDEVDHLLSGFEMLCASVRVLGEVTPRALDAIAGLGERMAARILAGAIRSAGVLAEAIDATELIVTNDRYQNATPLMEPTRERTRARLLPLMQSGVVPVVTGFIAATEKGVPTTLGRGGSDYSASIIATALDATDVFNYTDVDGVLTSDPRIVAGARTIQMLTAQEMSEMAYFGASVLHPMTIAPLMDKNIPLRVKNTFNPSHEGTLIVHRNDASPSESVIKAVTAIKNVSMMTVSGAGLKGVPGIAGRTFMAVARTGTSVLMISQASSEQNICFVIPQSSSQKVVAELSTEFRSEMEHGAIDPIDAFSDASIITAVGMGISETPGVSGRVFSALGASAINVFAIAQGSSECAISMIVAADKCDDAVRAVHQLTAA